jgi:hypothetical protein
MLRRMHLGIRNVAVLKYSLSNGATDMPLDASFTYRETNEIRACFK